MKLTRKTLDQVYNALLKHCQVDDFALMYENFSVILSVIKNNKIMPFITNTINYDQIYFKIWQQLINSNNGNQIYNDAIHKYNAARGCDLGDKISIFDFCKRYDLNYDNTKYVFIQQLFYRLKYGKNPIAIRQYDPYQVFQINRIRSLEEIMINADLS